MKAGQHDEFVARLKARFEKHTDRHKGLAWPEIESRLNSSRDKLRSLGEMEDTGGEPDVIGRDSKTGEFIFCDCATESPAGRRSLCYDGDALKARKENKPKGSAMEMAKAMGIELLTEEQYRMLQKLGTFDSKTSSWIRTPPEIRKLDGALFCDHRYGQVFTYHNGSQSYYAARGFRGLLKI